MASQAERSAAMRERLIEVGARLFAELGYEATSMTLLLREAGASKGALYHHFASKQVLFEAIFEHVADASIKRALRRPISPIPTSQLDLMIAGALQWLNEVRRSDVSRIVLEEGPRVLGYERARDLEAKYSLGLMRRGLERAVEAGEIDLPDLDLTARLVNAALGEAALISLQKSRRPSRAKINESIRRLIKGLARPG